MKVLFINKYDVTGGAGITATRLAQGLQIMGDVDIRFLVGVRRSSDVSVTATRQSRVEEFIERGVNVLTSAAGFQYVWFPFSTERIRRHTFDWKPDVVSVHNLHGGYFDLALLKEISTLAPIVWTMHDMWAFTANSAHTFGDVSWRSMRPGPDEHRQFPRIGIRNGSWLLRRKDRIYRHSRLSFVGPSEWIVSLARQSPLLSDKKVHHIPNGIDTDIFSPRDRSAARGRLGVPMDASVVAFGAEKILASSHKGGRLLVEILRELDSRLREPLHLLLFGRQSSSLREKGWNMIRMHPVGYVKDEADLAEILSAADVFIHPSRADTFPVTLLEATACGVPCVTYAVGGCPEIVLHGRNGFAVMNHDAKAFVDRVLELLADAGLRRSFSQEAVKIARERFSIGQMADGYKRLFEAVQGMAP